MPLHALAGTLMAPIPLEVIEAKFAERPYRVTEAEKNDPTWKW